MKDFVRKVAVLGVLAVLVVAISCKPAVKAADTKAAGSGSENGSGTGTATANPEYKVEGVTFKMIDIPAVTGGSVGHEDQNNNKPHTVSLTAYRIGETEVTQELWQAVMGSNPSSFRGSGKEPAAGEVQEKRPVENVNWYECIAFCNELTKKVTELGAAECVYYLKENETTVYTKEHAEAGKEPVQKLEKKGFRLPTEAEWEWAAKGGKDDKWAGTNEKNQLEQYAWYSANKTHQVGNKLANGYGLHDMSGNVWEWCWDWYSSSMPAGGERDTAGAASGSYRVGRGGSWFDNAKYCVVGLRVSILPDWGSGSLGFRVACRP